MKLTQDEAIWLTDFVGSYSNHLNERYRATHKQVTPKEVPTKEQLYLIVSLTEDSLIVSKVLIKLVKEFSNGKTKGAVLKKLEQNLRTYEQADEILSKMKRDYEEEIRECN